MNDSAWIALFGCLGVAVPSLVGAYVAVWTKRNVGKSNGHGPLNTAIHHLIVSTTQQDLANEVRFQAVFDHLKMKSPIVPTYDRVEQMLNMRKDMDEL